MVAGQGGLVEDGRVAADEAPVVGDSGIVKPWPADVKHLAVVSHIGVVTPIEAFTGEVLDQWGIQVVFDRGGELIPTLAHDHFDDHDGGHDQGCEDLHNAAEILDVALEISHIGQVLCVSLLLVRKGL
jgi:hypothetical protein